MAEFEPAPRVVKPRSRRYRPLPIMAVHGDYALSEAGELLTFDELIVRLPTLPPTLFVAADSVGLLVRFDQILSVSDPVTWQWRTSNDQRVVHKSNMHTDKTGRRRYVAKSTITVAFFGFKHGNYHKLIDPMTMFAQRFDKVIPGDDDHIVRLLRWGISLRNFCNDNNLEVRPTMGSISVQFLTDSRFYPERRRKVPGHTNQTARESLPGHYYHLNVIPQPWRSWTAYVIDQHRAHHYHAQHLHFPSADHLYAYGYYHGLDHYYRNDISPDFMGLYCLDLLAPTHRRNYTWLAGRGHLQRQFIFTNELPHLLNLGFKVLGVRAAWGSHHRDTGLNKFADWACQQLDRYPDPWLKPLLLSTYGTLASRRSYGETVFRLASRGQARTMLTGRGPLTGKLVKRPMALEAPVVNVIQLGMIQTATRSESVGLAQWLEHQSHRILQIFADAVIIEADDDRPLPVLPEPWRIKRELTHYQPISKQAYTSDQETKNPGVHINTTNRRMVSVQRPTLYRQLPHLSHITTGD